MIAFARRAFRSRHRIQRQLTAIQAGIDPVLVGERINALETERRQTEIALAEIEREHNQHATIDLR